ncbi:MAG: transposase [Goleter apudmare HA4340-LM2]|nr:transposase [Goleter apudmare HA4340-LM2]
MKQLLTLVCKINVKPEQLVKVQETFRTFSDACSYVNQEVPEKLTNEIAMQSLIYQDVRARFGLPSQLAIHAIRRVCSNRKTAKSKGDLLESFAPTSVTYDIRTLSLKGNIASLTLLGGREKFALGLSNYHTGKLSKGKIKGAVFVLHRDGRYTLNIQIETNPDAPEKVNKVLGVDLGRTDIAATSDGESFSGKQITEVRNKYAQVRQSIQKKASKGTRSTRRRARRLLQRLSGKERRFQSHTNHVVSKHLVQLAKTTNRAIALEDLTGIRERNNELPRSKTERRLSNSWAFFQLRQFLIYKAIAASIPLILVNPAYTSQTCHKCNHIHPVRGQSYRNGKRFACGHCGWKGDADYNGAKNIEAIGLNINQPGGSELACSLSDHVLGLLKTPSSYEVG